MDCEQARRLLSFLPRGATVPGSPAVRSHLERCSGCRSFWQALLSVDEALAARPLASPEDGFVEGVMGALQQRPRREIAPPFSRAFCLFGAALTLCALVGGALLLHGWSTASPDRAVGLPVLWLSPAWPNDASAWLSIEGDRVAQVVLAAMTGVLITVASAIIGFRASEQRTDELPVAQEHVPRPRS